MPTLLNLNGFKIFFYANEHPPAHVHILKGSGWAKVILETQEVIYSSLKASELKEALNIIRNNQKQFQEVWNEWFNR